MNRGDDEIWNAANTIYLYAALSELSLIHISEPTRPY